MPGQLEKSFKVPGGLLIPIIGIAAILWLLSGLNKNEIISAVIFIGLTMGLYFVIKKFKKGVTVVLPAD